MSYFQIQLEVSLASQSGSVVPITSANSSVPHATNFLNYLLTEVNTDLVYQLYG